MGSSRTTRTILLLEYGGKLCLQSIFFSNIISECCGSTVSQHAIPNLLQYNLGYVLENVSYCPRYVTLTSMDIVYGIIRGVDPFESFHDYSTRDWRWTLIVLRRTCGVLGLILDDVSDDDSGTSTC